jgi:16S rRNA (uracil1498-N3)-methyltransferase
LARNDEAGPDSVIPSAARDPQRKNPHRSSHRIPRYTRNDRLARTARESHSWARDRLSLVNLILLFPEDFTGDGRVRIRGHRLEHIRSVHRARVGDELVVGVEGGKIGTGRIASLDGDALEMEISADRDPPPPLPLALVLALPRPKVLNRVIAAVTSMGIKRLFIVNAWRVERSYWSSPRIGEQSLRQQMIAGLEQARDTVLPQITFHRLFRPFVERELPAIIKGTGALVAHPLAAEEAPRRAEAAVTLAIGPEGGFIQREVESLEAIGFRPVRLGERVLRVETAIAAMVGRLF